MFVSEAHSERLVFHHHLHVFLASRIIMEKLTELGESKSNWTLWASPHQGRGEDERSPHSGRAVLICSQRVLSVFRWCQGKAQRRGKRRGCAVESLEGPSLSGSHKWGGRNTCTQEALWRYPLNILISEGSLETSEFKDCILEFAFFCDGFQSETPKFHKLQL